MIGRVILGVIAAEFFSSGFEEMRISPQASDTPIFSPAEVDEIDPSSTPYVQISGIPPVDGVCVYHYYENEPEGVKFGKKTYAPILAAPRAAPVSRRKPDVVSALVILDGCLPDQRPKDLPRSVRGLVSRGKSQVPALISNELTKQTLSLSPNVLLLEQRGAPTTMGGVEQIAVGTILSVFAIVPFFSRRRKFDERLVSSGDLVSAVEEIRPLISCSPSLLNPATDKCQITGGETEEVILMRLNCKVDKIPSIVVLTNKRLMIYRTMSNFLPMIGRIIERLIGKGAEQIPGGGLIMLAFEPFFETYEILFVREERRWRENLGFSDSEVLAGHVPWKKLSDFKIDDLPALVSSIRAGKDWLFRSASVRFYPRSIKKVFSLPKDFEIPDFVVLTVIRRLISEVHPVLAAAGCKVLAEAKSLELELSSP